MVESSQAVSEKDVRLDSTEMELHHHSCVDTCATAGYDRTEISLILATSFHIYCIATIKPRSDEVGMRGLLT